MQIWTRLAGELARPEVWTMWVERGVRVIIILGLAGLFTRLVRRMLARLRTYTIRMMDRRHEGSTFETETRAATIISVLSKFSSMIIWLVALVMALTELNFHIEPLLAGLGVAGLAFGLGAQTLIKDWLGGLFLLFEDQLRIGDGVIINGTSGTVEEINLRTTLLRGENGAVHVISNGSITTLSNLTRDYSYFVFEMILSHGADVVLALAIVNTVGQELGQEEPYHSLILAPMEGIGVDRLGERGVTIKARIKTLPSKQGIVGRELNRRVKQKLDAARIAFPQPLPPQ